MQSEHALRALRKGLSTAEVSEALRRTLAQPPPTLPPAVLPPGPWYALRARPRRPPPWWALLLSGLGIGAALALLFRFLRWRREMKRLALQPPVEDPEKQRPVSCAGSRKLRLADLTAEAKETLNCIRQESDNLQRSKEQQQRLYVTLMGEGGGFHADLRF